MTVETDFTDLGDLAVVRHLYCGGWARDMRVAAHISLREFARAADVSFSALSKYETGQQLPSPAVAQRLGRELSKIAAVRLATKRRSRWRTGSPWDPGRRRGS